MLSGYPEYDGHEGHLGDVPRADRLVEAVGGLEQGAHAEHQGDAEAPTGWLRRWDAVCANLVVTLATSNVPTGWLKRFAFWNIPVM